MTQRKKEREKGEGSCKVTACQQEEVNAIEKHVHAKPLQPCSPLALQAPLSMGFSRRQYWSGLPISSVGDFPHLGIKPMSLSSPALAGRFFTTSATWELQFLSVGRYWCCTGPHGEAPDRVRRQKEALEESTGPTLFLWGRLGWTR